MAGYDSLAPLVLATYSGKAESIDGEVARSSLKPDEILLKHILMEGVRASRSKGDYLCRQGALADEVHALTSGAVGVSMRGIGSRARYHFFLFAPFLVIPPVNCEGRTPLSMECLLPCETHTISRRTLSRLVDEGEIPREAIELNLARLFDLANQQLANLLCRSGAARVAHMLSLLAATMRRSAPIDGQDDGGLAIELTQVQLASSLGMSPVYLNQIFKTFKRDGIISIRSGRLFIEDEVLLREMALAECLH
ncbi:MAG: Crp/Fnr family transcriptional regulator [Erythrobacter sp.]|jgi:CRP-like cAMP-binding protein|nr:Crp/Fnr family transcriptional regulator [Erythrobacter sp.]